MSHDQFIMLLSKIVILTSQIINLHDNRHVRKNSISFTFLKSAHDRVARTYIWPNFIEFHRTYVWRHTSIKSFYFLLIWNLLSSTNCTSLGLITWRHHPEISCDEQKCTWKPGNMVERHSWTKNPPLFSTRKIFAELF